DEEDISRPELEFSRIFAEVFTGRCLVETEPTRVPEVPDVNDDWTTREDVAAEASHKRPAVLHADEVAKCDLLPWATHPSSVRGVLPRWLLAGQPTARNTPRAASSIAGT